MIEMKMSDTQKLMDSLRGKVKNFNVRARQGLIVGMEEFKGTIQRDQMSGRKFADFGLKAPTGNLRRSWRVSKRQYGEYDFVVKLATDTKYARIHQYGGVVRHPGGTPYYPTRFTDGKFIPLRKEMKGTSGVRLTKPHNIKIPKRLHIIEEYRETGKDIIMASIHRHVAGYKGRTGIIVMD
jgi:phage gpG-like protein